MAATMKCQGRTETRTSSIGTAYNTTEIADLTKDPDISRVGLSFKFVSTSGTMDFMEQSGHFSTAKSGSYGSLNIAN